MLQNLSLRHLQYNRQTRRFFMTIIALGFVIDGVYAVLLNLYMLRLGYDATFIGQVNSIGLLVFALMSFPAGVFGARFTSSRMLRVGMGVILLGTALLPLAEFTPAGWQGGWLIVTYALVLSGFSLYFVNGAPFLMASVTPDNQSSAFAMQTALLSVAAFVGSLVGGIMPVLITRVQALTLDDPQPYRYTLMLVGLVAAAALLITMTLVEPEDKDSEAETEAAYTSTKKKRKNTSYTWAVILLIGLMSLVRFFQVAGMATTSVFFNVYLDTQLGLTSDAIGAIASIGRFIAVPTVLLAPYLIKRTSTGTVATLASLATALCLLPIALVPQVWAAALGYIGATAVTNLRFTAFIVFIMTLVPKRQQAVMAGAGEMAAGFSFAGMALFGGYIVALFGFRDLFLLGAVMSGIGTLIFWLHLRSNQRAVENQLTVDAHQT